MEGSKVSLQTWLLAIHRLATALKESLNKGVNSEFDLSNVKLKQPSPESQPEIRNSAPKTAEFR